jgi:hypothetical protein
VPTISPADGVVGASDPTPSAAVSLLLAADAAPVLAAFGLYASCAHAVEVNVGGLTPRRCHVVVPPACRRSRVWVTRSGSIDPLVPVQAGPHSHASATGGGYTAPWTSVQDCPVQGAEVYLQTHATLPMDGCAVVATGATVNDAPAAPVDRALAVPEGLSVALELYEFRTVCGWSVQFFERTADLEAL